MTRTFPGPTPSGLFPSGPPRPTYRESHPVRGVAVGAGLGAGALWMLLFGLLAQSVRSYGWLTICAGAAAWLVAVLLARRGDRGVAVGLAISAGLAIGVLTVVVGVVWAMTGWPLW